MKKLLLFLLLPACASMTPAQNSAFIGSVTALASAAATAYGKPQAAAGLNALGAVLQAYVGQPIPSKVVAATPATGSMGVDMAGLISNTKPVTQADANALFQAAAIVAK